MDNVQLSSKEYEAVDFYIAKNVDVCSSCKRIAKSIFVLEAEESGRIKVCTRCLETRADSTLSHKAKNVMVRVLSNKKSRGTIEQPA